MFKATIDIIGINFLVLVPDSGHQFQKEYYFRLQFKPLWQRPLN